MTRLVIDNQVYIYFQGVLIYKRWLTPHTYGRVFHENEGLTQYAK